MELRFPEYLQREGPGIHWNCDHPASCRNGNPMPFRRRVITYLHDFDATPLGSEPSPDRQWLYGDVLPITRVARLLSGQI